MNGYVFFFFKEKGGYTILVCVGITAVSSPHRNPHRHIRRDRCPIVNGRAPITPDMAVRLAGVFGTEPEIWVNLQAQYDLWLVRQQAKPKVKRLHAVA